MDYDAFRADAVEMIKDFGNGLTATIHRDTATYNPVTQVETHAELSHSILVVTVDLDRRLDADMVGLARLKAYVPATGLGMVPRQNDQITLPGRNGRYVIQQVRDYDPDGVPIMFELFLGKP